MRPGSISYFGFDASDWHDEAEFSVCFRDRPDEAALERIARSLEASGIPFGYRCRYYWSGPLLLFSASARGRGAVRRWAEVLHRQVPIVDVVFEGIRDGQLEAGAPAPGPVSQRFAFAVRPTSPALPEWAQDPVYDAVAAHVAIEARRKAARPGLEKVLNKQKARAGVVFELVADRVPPSASDPRFDPFDIPAEPFVVVEDSDAEQQLAPGDHPVLGVLERPVAWVVREARSAGSLREAFAVLVDGERIEAKLPAGLDCTSVSVHPSEPRALVVASGFLFEVDLKTGGAKLKPRVGRGLAQAAYLADGHWVCVGTAVVVFDADDQAVDCAASGAGFCCAFAGGRGLLTGPSPLGVDSFANRRLKREVELRASGFWRVLDVQADPVIEMIGGTLVARGAAAHVAREQRPSRAKAQVLPAILRFRPFDGPRPDAPAPDPDVLPGSAGPASEWAASPSGGWVAFRKPGDEWLHVYEAASESEEAVDYNPDFFAVRDDGTVVAHSVVGTRWRRPGPKLPPTEEWPGVCSGISNANRVEYLARLDVIVLYFADGSFCMRACDGPSVVDFWRGRGVTSVFEIDDGVVLEGSIGRFLVTGFADLVQAFRPRQAVGSSAG